MNILNKGLWALPLVALYLSPSLAYAEACADDHCIYRQSFDQPANTTLTKAQFSLNTGWNVDTPSWCASTVKFIDSGRAGFGSAVVIDSASAACGISIDAAKLFANAHQLPAAGTISFWFKPTASPTTSDTDWLTNGFVARSHYFFNLQDPVGTSSILGLRKYRAPSAVSFLSLDAAGSAGLNTNPEDLSLLGPSANWSVNDGFHLIEIVWDVAHSYVALIINGNYVREGSLNSSATATFSAGTIFTFGNFGNVWGDPWTLTGAIDEFKVYNVAKYGYRDPAQYQSKAVGNGVREPWETPENSPADAVLNKASMANAGGALRYFFSTPAYQKVTESTLPVTGAAGQKIYLPTYPGDKLKVHVQPGEIQSVYVNYYNRTTQIDNATISVTDFVHDDDPGHTIANPELFVVSNWFQAGDSLLPGGLPRYVPELLLTEETPALNGYTNSKASDNVTDALPDLPVPSQSVTAVKLPENSTRQFMVRLTVPSNAKPGTYTGSLAINAGSAGTLPIEVTVGTAPLAELDRDAMVFHQDYYDVQQNEHQGGDYQCLGSGRTVSLSSYEAELADLRNHGLNSEHAYGYGPVNAGLIKDYGLDRTVVLNYPTCLWNAVVPPLVSDERANFGSSPLYFFSQDEIHLFREKICGHIEVYSNLAPLGAPIATTTSIALNSSLKTTQSYTEGGRTCAGPAPIDLMSMQADGGGIDALPFLARRALKDPAVASLPASKNLYYWQLFSEDGRVNRFNAGYLLWMTEMDGINPFGYMPDDGNGPSAFDDFHGDSRRDQAVYPSINGPLQTLQWEALRDGLNDYRYMLTWKNLLYAADHSGDPVQVYAANASRDDKLTPILNRYKNAVITPIKNNCGQALTCLNSPDQSMFLRNVAPSEFADDRATAQQQIEYLQAIGQHGLTVSYFNDGDTNGNGAITALDDKLVGVPVLQRIEPNINFYYAGSPEPGVVTADNFSASFTGRLIVPAYTGTYTFCLKGDDGVRLWINNVNLFDDDHWVAQDSVTACATVPLVAGESVAIRMEFFDLTEEAIAELKWSWPGQAPQVVPSSSLYAQ